MTKEREDLHNLPFGPLTLEAHDRLSSTSLDASQQALQRVAQERGVEFGSAARRKFAEAFAKRRQELQELGYTDPLYGNEGEQLPSSTNSEEE